MSRTKQAARKGQGPRAAVKAKKDKRVLSATRDADDASSEGGETKSAATKPARLKENKSDDAADVPQGGSSEIDTPTAQKPAKLKRDRDDFESDKENAASPPAKKKKYKSKKDREAAKPTEDDKDGAGDNFDAGIAQMDPALLADHFAKTIKRLYRNDTELELEERYLPSSTFTDTTSAIGDRRKGQLGAYLEAVVGDRSRLTSPTKDKASPHTIVLCSSGIRGADLGRVLRTYETEGNKVAKLFAKHFKIEQQAVFLRKTSVGFGVCTPDRVKKLIETKALKTDRLARIVIDGSYLDEKKRGFWNMAEVFRPMLDLLKMDEVQERIKDGSLKVMVF
jgi:protein CMS1